MTPREDGDPDLLQSLANERTLLAWVRTSLSLAAAGAAALKLPAGFPAAGRSIGAAMIGLGALVWAAGYARYRAAERAVASGRGAVSPGTVRLVALAASAAAVGALFIGAWGS